MQNSVCRTGGLRCFGWDAFSRPEQLQAKICISFADCGMTCAFYEALVDMGYHPCTIKTCGSRICFVYQTPITPGCGGFAVKFVRRLAQCKNRLFCLLYRFITRPFCCTLDKLIYLYFYLPFSFRCCMRMHRYKKVPAWKKEKMLLHKSDKAWWGCRKMSYSTRITQAFCHAPVLPLNSSSRYVLFSDCHRGSGTANDNFLKNQHLYIAALRHYYQNQFVYIELGDGDELWENRKNGADYRSTQ